jgi:2-polyprenyl-6-methoxyphenol hydroxylase-like FAD-dependent oxidoreductase
VAGADQPVRKVTIVGGGTAGWMAAAVLSQWLTKIEIKLIESDAIGIIGVGESTIPHIRNYLALAGIDELKMISEAKATFNSASSSSTGARRAKLTSTASARSAGTCCGCTRTNCGLPRVRECRRRSRISITMP